MRFFLQSSALRSHGTRQSCEGQALASPPVFTVFHPLPTSTAIAVRRCRQSPGAPRSTSQPRFPQATDDKKPVKKEWVQQFIQKTLQQFQTDENKKWLQVFLIDPVLNYILERMFPYILILTVMFVLLIVMITITLILVFTRVPAVFGATIS